MEDSPYDDIVEVNKKLGERVALINPGNLDFIIEKEKTAKALIRKISILLHGIS